MKSPQDNGLLEENEALRSNIRELQSQITSLHKMLEDSSRQKRLDSSDIGIRQALSILLSSIAHYFKQ